MCTLSLSPVPVLMFVRFYDSKQKKIGNNIYSARARALALSLSHSRTFGQIRICSRMVCAVPFRLLSASFHQQINLSILFDFVFLLWCDQHHTHTYTHTNQTSPYRTSKWLERMAGASRKYSAKILTNLQHLCGLLSTSTHGLRQNYKYFFSLFFWLEYVHIGGLLRLYIYLSSGWN